MDMLQDTFEFLNADPRVRHVTHEFRALRRSIFGRGNSDYTALRNCSEVFHYELDLLHLKILGTEDYEKFSNSKKTFAECLKA